MRERNMAPFLFHCWKCAVANSTHTVCWSSFSMCGIHFVQTFDFQSCLWESETCCRYAAFHRIHCAYFAGVFLEHSTKTLHISLICCSCRCDTVRNIFCILSSITNSIQWPARVWYHAEWVSSLSFKKSWLSWCFPKQEMKLNKVWTSIYEKLPFICSGSIVQLNVNEQKKLFLTVPQDQHCCHTVLPSIPMLGVYWCGHWPYGTNMVVLEFWSHCTSPRFW